jgi:hypothetical protein
MLHIDDERRLAGFGEFLSAPGPPPADTSDPLQRMLFVLLGYMREPLSEM